MTYKSISPHLVALERSGVLHRYKPEAPRTARRALYFTSEVDKEVTHHNSAVNFHKARAFVERVMERWVVGEHITVSMSGGGTGAFLARLDAPPAGVWELRVTEPKPQFRLFAQFVGKDVLVVTHVHNRSVLSDRHRQNKSRSGEWSDAMHDCCGLVKKHLSADCVIVSDSIDDYITENFHVL